MKRVILLLLVFLISCQPQYVPDQQTLATREAAEYVVKVARSDMTFQLVLCFSFAILAAIVFFIWAVAWFYAQDWSASAGLEKAHARKAMLAALGNGVVLDLETGETYHTETRTVPLIEPVANVEFYDEVSTRGGLEGFILEAASVAENGWESKTLPRWDKWKNKGFSMTGAQWMRWTDELQHRYIDKKQGSRTVIMYNQDLRWLYNQLTHPEKHE